MTLGAEFIGGLQSERARRRYGSNRLRGWFGVLLLFVHLDWTRRPVMTRQDALIALLTAIEVVASGCYWANSDWRHGAFWTCAAIMNICVTW